MGSLGIDEDLVPHLEREKLPDLHGVVAAARPEVGNEAIDLLRSKIPRRRTAVGERRSSTRGANS